MKYMIIAGSEDGRLYWDGLAFCPNREEAEKLELEEAEALFDYLYPKVSKWGFLRLIALDS